MIAGTLGDLCSQLNADKLKGYTGMTGTNFKKFTHMVCINSLSFTDNNECLSCLEQFKRISIGGATIAISDNTCPNSAAGKVISSESHQVLSQIGLRPCHDYHHYVKLIGDLGYQVAHHADLSNDQHISLRHLYQNASAKQDTKSMTWLDSAIRANVDHDLGWVELVATRKPEAVSMLCRKM